MSTDLNSSTPGMNSSMPSPAFLTWEDGVEICVAVDLRKKRLSETEPDDILSEREIKEWVSHLQHILDVIGTDGINLVKEKVMYDAMTSLATGFESLAQVPLETVNETACSIGYQDGRKAAMKDAADAIRAALAEVYQG